MEESESKQRKDREMQRKEKLGGKVRLSGGGRKITSGSMNADTQRESN